MTNNDGFWVKYWMEYGRGSTTKEETYEFLKYSDGNTEEDKKNEGYLKILAQDWCQRDHMGWSFDSYHYGFEVVEKPPNKWIQKEFARLTAEIRKMEDVRTRIGREITVEE